ncbi:MAG: ECF transporter S component [Lachnospiraceae bacterium]
MEQTAKTHTNEKNTALFICMTALATALVCVATMVVQIPIPLGYAHLGDSCILLAAYLFGWKIGLFAGGVGSALADLSDRISPVGSCNSDHQIDSGFSDRKALPQV